ncbi:MAG: CAP domain-containing protein [Flavobacterium sp.]|uniref:CAP domain-containing protein n=1 Tax=Flavobacterium sp. TaxID=239 RepID=UPI0022C873AD|nr:CAP domain-containing protein [Flavobacterium sp.]MCZ8196835.1 CAP domain-containing protein [Flavobacterium sp.]
MKTNLLTSLLILVCSFTTISCSNDSEDLVDDSNAQLVTDYTYSADETHLVDLINNYRVSHGKNALSIINHISYKSQEHNLYMIEKNVVNHDYFEERSNNIIQVLGAIKVGENLAYNFSKPETVLNAWLLSSGHKANLDGDYTHVGISITIDPVTGKKYYTNMFMKK